MTLKLHMLNWRQQQDLKQLLLKGFLLIIAVLFLFPFYYMIISSLREPFYNFDRSTLDLAPSAFNIEGYKRILGFSAIDTTGSGDVGILLNGFKNTLILEVSIVLGSTLVNGLAAYAFAKRSFPGKQFFFMLLFVTMILPAEVTLVPKYVMFHAWGMLNTHWALIIPSLTGGIWAIFLMRQFMSTIPNAFIDAARIDGANEFQLITRVIFPLSTPVMATYALMTFLGVWNDLMGPLMYNNKPENWTLQLALYNYAEAYSFEYGSAYGDPTGLRMQTLFAGLLISALPTIIVFIIFQRQLVEGIVLTGLKG